MMLTVTSGDVEQVVRANLPEETFSWLQTKLDETIKAQSARDLFMTYSILSSKIADRDPLIMNVGESPFNSYLIRQNARILELARVYALMRVLEEDPDYYIPKVGTLIQVADTNELAAFLKYLIFLPNHEAFRAVAVEALRTNIATVFDAIALNNPYPASFFNDQQWNQMYLKAAFMQRDLSLIMGVEQRANADLTRIISDYAHERWAASRDIDPLFWRPVAGFLNERLLADMVRLLQSENKREQYAAALCCHFSEHPEAKLLLDSYPELKDSITSGNLGWESITNHL